VVPEQLPGKPGFEPVESGRTIDVTNPTPTNFCEIGNSYRSPVNFYKGATFEMVYSSNAAEVGTAGTITSYNATAPTYTKRRGSRRRSLFRS
jgi:hypothetical protein